ncbi:hypothetical protein D3C87_1034710 [compost metagenome]
MTNKAKVAPRKTMTPAPRPAAARAAPVDPRRSDDAVDTSGDSGVTQTNNIVVASPPTPTNESAVTANESGTLAGNEGGATPLDPAVEVVRRRVIGGNQKMVKVKVERAFRLDDGTGIHEYQSGPAVEMPAEHAEHWYAKAAGGVEYDGK